MVFSNSVFLFIFLPIVLFGYYFPVRKSIVAKNCWLLLASLLFYAWGEPVYILLMILSILVNYELGIVLSSINKNGLRKFVLFIACTLNLSVLFVFKYAAWLLRFFSILPKDSILNELMLPIGISFYTFQAMSYVIDVYSGKASAQKNILNLGLYIAFFPQLVAGPIVKYESIERQLSNRTETAEKFANGAKRFIIGLSKKLLLANALAVVANKAFVDNSDLTVVLSWAGSIAFTLQIYFDFSGYSDMAIGLGRMFGFEFAENFNYPYISRSIKEFWIRWHMSLGSWFREYIYIPLGGNKKGKFRKYINIMIVFLVSGFWHGAAWTFVAWGMINGLLQVIEDIIYDTKKNYSKFIEGLRVIVTLFAINFSWVLFKAETIKEAVDFYLAMFKLNGNQLIDQFSVYWIDQYKIVLCIGFILQFPILKKLVALFDNNDKLSETKELAETIILGILLCIDICYAVGGGYNPFLYFNF